MTRSADSKRGSDPRLMEEVDAFEAMSKLRREIRSAPEEICKTGLWLIAPFFIICGANPKKVDRGMMKILNWYLVSLPPSINLNDLMAIARRLKATKTMKAIEGCQPYEELAIKNKKEKEKK